MDVNKPVENPELVSAMEALQKNPSAETESAFFQQLQQANFLLVLHQGLEHTEPDEDGTITLSEGTTISIAMLSDAEGHPLYFGFTDWRALRAWNEKPNQKTLIMPFSQLLDMVLSEKTNCEGFIMNPSTHNFYIPKNILARVGGRGTSYTVQKKTQVFLGEPSKYPQDLADAVSVKLKTLRTVKRAWLLLMTRDEEQSYLIVLEHTGDQNTINEAIGGVASKHLSDGMFVDIVTTDQDFGRKAVEGRKTFYKRSLFA